MFKNGWLWLKVGNCC